MAGWKPRLKGSNSNHSAPDHRAWWCESDCRVTTGRGKRETTKVVRIEQRIKAYDAYHALIVFRENVKAAFAGKTYSMPVAKIFVSKPLKDKRWSWALHVDGKAIAPMKDTEDEHAITG